MEAYNIIEFEDNTTAVVPRTWLLDEEFVLWPPKSKEMYLKAMIANRLNPSSTWNLYKYKMLVSENLTYSEAIRREEALSGSCSSEGFEASDESSSDSNAPETNKEINKRQSKQRTSNMNTENFDVLRNNNLQHPQSVTLENFEPSEDNFNNVWNENLQHSPPVTLENIEAAEEQEAIIEIENVEQNQQKECRYVYCHCHELNKTTTKRIENCLVDLTKEIQKINSTNTWKKGKAPVVFKLCLTKEDFYKFNQELLHNEVKRDQFASKIKSIFKYNENVIGADVERFFKLILKSFFDPNLFSFITWKRYSLFLSVCTLKEQS